MYQTNALPKTVIFFGILISILLHLAKAATISGAVSADLLPLENASVTLLDANQDPIDGIDEQVTSALGQYSFSDLADGTYFVTVDPPAGSEYAPAAATEVVLSGGDAIQDFTLTLSQALISGRVLDQNAEPLTGAKITLFRFENSAFVQAGQSLTIAADGSYSFLVSAGDYFLRSNFFAGDVVLTGEPNFAQITTEDFTVTSDLNSDVTFNFVMLSGSVVDSNNIPISGAELSTNKGWLGPEQGPNGNTSQKSLNHGSGSTVTDLNGNYQMLLYSSDECIASGFFADSNDCLYDITLQPPTNSGFAAITTNDLSISANSTLNYVLELEAPSTPRISAGPFITNITDTAAVVEWQTDKPSTSTVAVTGGATINEAELTNFHQVTLTSLSPNTNYALQISSTDIFNNTSNSASASFTTSLATDTSAPVFTQGPNIIAIDQDQLVVAFCANESVTGQITVNSDQVDLTGYAPCFETVIPNLSADTSYSISATITDIAGNGPTQSISKTVRTLTFKDEVAPIIVTGPFVTAVSDSSALVTWTTNEPATSGATLNDGIRFQNVSDEALVTVHTLQFFALTANTTYNLQVASADAADNVTNSSIVQFTTRSSPDTFAPQLLGRPLIQDVSDRSVFISWLTDEPATTVLKMGLAANALTRVETVSGFVRQHGISLIDLSPNTTYFFSVQSADSLGNSTDSTILSFTTQPALQPTPAQILSGPLVERVTATTLTVSWKTTVNTTARLVCSANNTVKEVERLDLAKNHRLSLTGLSLNTGYNCNIFSIDVFGFTVSESFSAGTDEVVDVTAPTCLADPEVAGLGTSAEITWQNSEPSSATVFYRRQNETQWQQDAAPTLDTSGFLIISGLEQNTLYEQQIVLTDIAGNTGDCAITTFNSGDGIPAPIFTIQPFVTDIDHQSATINWSTELVSFGQVRYGLSPEALTLNEAANDALTEHQIALNNLSANTTYFVQVEATNSEGDSTLSEIVSFTTSEVPIVAPQIITGPTVTNITDVSAVVEWQTDKETTGSVEIPGVDTFENNQLTDSHSIVITGLTPSTTYTANVSATDKFGLNTEPASADFTTAALPDTTAPRFVSTEVSAIDIDQFTLSFCADEPVTGEVFVDGVRYELPELLTCHEININGLEQNTAYSVYCIIYDAAGNGPTISETIELTTLLFVDDAPPVILTGPIVSEITASTALVSWTTDEPADSGVSYNDGSVFSEVSDSDFVLTHTMQLNNLTPSTTYSLTVSSTDALGNGPTISETIEFTTAALPDTTSPIIINGPVIQDITDNSAVVIWETDESATSVVLYSTDANNLELTETSDGYNTEHNVSLTGLSAETTYFLQVQSSDASSNTVTSDVISFTTLATIPVIALPNITEGPTVERVTETTVTIGWTTDLNTDSRLVCSVDDITKEISDPTRSKEHLLTLTGLEPATTYDCTVYSMDLNGNIASASVDATTSDLPDTLAPACIGDPESLGFGTSSEVTWLADELSSALIQYRIQGAENWLIESELALTKEGFVLLTNLTADSSYELLITLTDESNNSADCNLITFESGAAGDLPAPVFTVQPTISDIGDNNATVNWSTVLNSYGVVFYGLSENTLDNSEAATTANTQHSVTLRNLAVNTTYYVQVEAKNSEDATTLSDIVSFTTTFPDPDLDDDTILNDADNCPTTANTDQLDTDNDGLGNVCDDDDDNDGCLDPDDDFPLDPLECVDSDDDGIGNNTDPDDDGDNVDDVIDIFPFDPSPVLSGIVTGAGATIEGAEVSLYDADQVVLRTTLTDSAGEYRFESLTAGDYFVGVNPPESTGFRAPPIQAIVMADRNVRYLITLVGDAITVSGFLRDSLNRAIDNTQVTLHLQDTGNQVGNRVITDDNGYFEFAVAPGTYKLRPYLDAFGPGTTQAQSLPSYPVPDFATLLFSPENIEVTADIEIDAVVPLAILSGQTVDTNGDPVAGVVLNINHQLTENGQSYVLENYGIDDNSNAISDADGNFAFAVFTDQATNIVLTPPADRQDLAVTTIDSYSLSTDTTETFALVQGASLTGTLRDSEGRTIDFSQITLYDQASEVQIGRPSFTDANGNFAFQVEDGTYKFKVSLTPFGDIENGNPTSYPVPDLASVSFAEENVVVAGNTDVDITVPLAQLSGSIVDGNGDNVAGVALQVSLAFTENNIDYVIESRGTATVTNAISDENGQFSIAYFIDQTFDIVLFPPAGNALAPTQVSSYVLNADTTEQFALADALTLSGYLRDNQGIAIDNVMISAHDQSNNQRAAEVSVTDVNGYFEFKVAAGTYKLRPYLQPNNPIVIGQSKPNYPVPDFASVYYVPENIEVTDDTEVAVTVPMSILSGQALDANGVPVAGVQMQVDHAFADGAVSYYLENSGTGNLSNAVTDPFGSFGFGLFTDQDIDVSVVPPTDSGFAITTVSHRLTQETLEDVFLQHFDDPPPSIVSGPTVFKITDQSALVEFETDKPCTYELAISGGDTYTNPNLNRYHSIVVTQLLAQTLYNATLTCVDKENQSTEETPVSWTTLPTPDTRAPQFVEGPLTTSISHDEFIYAFCADEPVTGVVTVDAESFTLENLAICHKILVDARLPSTTYIALASISDAAGNGPTVSKALEITTLPEPDNDAPLIMGMPIVIDITDTEATVKWLTNEPATSGVSYNNGREYHVVTDNNFVVEHAMQLVDLSPETTYYLTVSSSDQQGNGPTLSESIEFTTLATPDTTAPLCLGQPIIQNVTHQSVVIRWRTNESASTQVAIGKTANDLDQIESRNGFRTFHNVAITQLDPDTEYFFQAISTDAAGNRAECGIASFQTKAKKNQCKTHIKERAKVKRRGRNSCTVNWETDVNADSRLVCEGDGQVFEKNSARKVKKHQLTLTGLRRNTSYRCTAYSKDTDGFISSSKVIWRAEDEINDNEDDDNQRFDDDCDDNDNDNAQEQERDFVTRDKRDVTKPKFKRTPKFKGLGRYCTIDIETDELTNTEVEYRRRGSSRWQKTGSTRSRKKHNITLSELQPNSEYEVRFKKSDLEGNITFSDIYNFNSDAEEELTQPEFTEAPSFDRLKRDSVRLRWQTKNYCAGQIEYGKNPNQLSLKEGDGDLGREKDLTLANLDPATTYYARIKAYNLEGEETSSELISFTTAAANATDDSDGDGMPDDYELTQGFNPQDASDADNDNDNDGLSNREEFAAQTDPNVADSDNDGMPDGWEIDRNLNPNDPSDATLDPDNNGLTNLAEFQAAVDTTAPVISLTESITIDANGIRTAIPTTGVSASDVVDGTVAVTIVGEAYLPPGRHIVTWQAVDGAGNRSTATQTVNIRPQILVRSGQTTAEGQTVSLNVTLSGDAPEYPVEIPYTTGGSATSDDFVVVEDSIRITEGRSGQLFIGITDDALAENTETLTITLNNPTNARLGANTTHTISIIESNVPPRLTVTATQNGNPVKRVTPDDGDVTVTISIDDANPDDTHSINWNQSDSNLVDLDNEPLTLTFDPTGLNAGVYKAAVTVTDSGSPALSTLASITIKVLATSPTLLNTADSDGDGLSDAEEGLSDSDNDGIPDYLDNIDASYILQALLGEASDSNAAFLMECEPGLRLALGAVALGDDEGGAQVDQSLIDDNPEYAQFGDDSQFTNVGGYFDFEITGLTNIGDSVRLVIPQSQTIPSGAVYRKLHPVNGWQDFVEDDNNQLFSAPGAEGQCPSPGDVTYTEGLNEGDWCIMLLIEDGGPNDADATANGTVVDPSGIAIVLADDTSDEPVDDPVDNPTDDPVDEPVDQPVDEPVDEPVDDNNDTPNQPAAPAPSGGGGGGSFNGLLLLLMLIAIGLRRQRRSQSMTSSSISANLLLSEIYHPLHKPIGTK